MEERRGMIKFPLLETAHGYYDRMKGTSNSSIRPMNVKSTLWSGLGYSRDELKDPEKNIEAGIRIIKGIQDRMTDKDIKKIRTLYNGLGQTDVSLYGKRIQEFYDEKPWKRR